MTGSPNFSLDQTLIERPLKKLGKGYKSPREKQIFQRFIAQILKDLCSTPRPPKSALEPLPGKIRLPQEYEFRKLRFAMPGLKGASGQGRLMYLINSAQNLIVLIWIYTHEQFERRPDEKSLEAVLQDAIASLPEKTDLPANTDEQTNFLENNDAPTDTF